MEDVLKLEIDLTEVSFIGSRILTAFDEALKLNLGSKGKNKFGVCDLKIKASEGPIPHFHIESKSTENYCCVCIYQPLYFKHNDKETELSREQKIILDNFMDKHWSELDRHWKQAYGGEKFEHYCDTHGLDINKLSKPDYTTMKDSIHD